MAEYQYLDDDQAVAKMALSGVHRRPRTVQRWMRDHRIAVKIAGRWLIPSAAVDLLLAGTPLPEIAEQLRVIKITCSSSPELLEVNSPAGGRLARRQIGRRGSRRRG